MTMMMSSIIFSIFIATSVILFLFFTPSPVSSSSSSDRQTDVSRLVFSAVFVSCNKHTADQSYWNKIPRAVVDKVGLKKEREWKKDVQNHKIDTLVWLGDSVYNDHSPLPSLWFPSSIEVMREKYDAMKNNANYSNFVKNHIKKGPNSVIGVYDDHDYGMNDGGKNYQDREASQQLFLDFINVSSGSSSEKSPENSHHHQNVVRRSQRKGVYNFQKFPVRSGSSSNKSVCFALLDVRYHRDDPRPDGEGDILGEDQWRWLETVLVTGMDLEEERYKDPALQTLKSISEVQKAVRAKARTRKVFSIDDECAVTFVGSGTQILSDEKPSESWGMFPHSRNKLLKLLSASGARKLVLLSGDVHLGEIFRLWKKTVTTTKTSKNDDGSPGAETVVTLPASESESPFSRFFHPDLLPGLQTDEEHQALWEVTSSGLTHDSSTLVPPGIYEKIFPNPQRRFEEAVLMKNFGVIRVFEKSSSSATTTTADDDSASASASDGGSGPVEFKVEVSIHAIKNGFEQNWITPKFRPFPRFMMEGWDSELLLEKHFEQFPEIRYFHLEPLPAPLTNFILTIQKKLAPTLSRHKVIFITIVCAFLGAVAFIFLFAVCTRRIFFVGQNDNNNATIMGGDKLKQE